MDMGYVYVCIKFKEGSKTVNLKSCRIKVGKRRETGQVYVFIRIYKTFVLGAP